MVGVHSGLPFKFLDPYSTEFQSLSHFSESSKGNFRTVKGHTHPRTAKLASSHGET
jgi:hypothetical protein